MPPALPTRFAGRRRDRFPGGLSGVGRWVQSPHVRLFPQEPPRHDHRRRPRSRHVRPDRRHLRPPVRREGHREDQSGDRLDLRRRVPRGFAAVDLQRDQHRVRGGGGRRGDGQQNPRRRGPAAPRRREGPRRRARGHRRPAPRDGRLRHRRAADRAGRHRDAGAGVQPARRADRQPRAGRGDGAAADPPRAAGFRRPHAQGGGVRDGHQGDRPAHAVHPAAARRGCSAGRGWAKPS